MGYRILPRDVGSVRKARADVMREVRIDRRQDRRRFGYVANGGEQINRGFEGAGEEARSIVSIRFYASVSDIDGTTGPTVYMYEQEQVDNSRILTQ